MKCETERLVNGNTDEYVDLLTRSDDAWLYHYPVMRNAEMDSINGHDATWLIRSMGEVIAALPVVLYQKKIGPFRYTAILETSQCPVIDRTVSPRVRGELLLVINKLLLDVIRSNTVREVLIGAPQLSPIVRSARASPYFNMQDFRHVAIPGMVLDLTQPVQLEKRVWNDLAWLKKRNQCEIITEPARIFEFEQRVKGGYGITEARMIKALYDDKKLFYYAGEMDGEIEAFISVLNYQNASVYWRAGTTNKGKKNKINTALLWAAIQDQKQRASILGLNQVLTETQKQAAITMFKRGFATAFMNTYKITYTTPGFDLAQSMIRFIKR